MNLLFLITLIPILLIAPSHVFAISSNQTSSNETTNNLLKAILNENKLQIQLQQDNANVIATKVDNLRVELQHQQQPPFFNFPPCPAANMSNCNPQPPSSFPVPLPPGAVAIPPSQQHGPPLAQIQSDIAKHQQQGIQYAQAMTSLFNQRLDNDTSTAHAIQVLKQMTAEGKINCPAPFANPGHCFLTPKPVGIAPPIG
jgi:hypothetical protein